MPMNTNESISNPRQKKSKNIFTLLGYSPHLYLYELCKLIIRNLYKNICLMLDNNMSAYLTLKKTGRFICSPFLDSLIENAKNHVYYSALS